ncbi:MAG: Smr/MutS family protein [Chitinispirillaceae bacterium]|nr:Smr/MutS family protein [Chitinispirillaceae bacterium]
MNNNKKLTKEEIISYIEKHGIVKKDKDISISTTKKQQKKAEKPYRMTIDLHGMKSDEASAKLRYALERCKDIGKKELLVIHGYGLHSSIEEGPVLKKLVRDMLDNELRLRYKTYRPAKPSEGGEGATLIIVS